MKLLFLLLLLPACIHSQNFRIEGSNKCKCNDFNLTIYALSFDGTVAAHIDIMDNLYPRDGDSLLYNGRTWVWKYKTFHLYRPTGFIIRTAPMKAKSAAENFLESDDSNYAKVYYLRTDTPNDTVFTPIFPRSHAALVEMSDSFNVNNKKSLILMRKKGCMQRQSCRDSILFYQGKSISYLELEKRF